MAIRLVTRQIEARGKIVDAGGTLTFDLLNGATMVLILDPKGVPVRPGSQAIEITGVSRADGKAAEKLALTKR